MTKTKAEPYSIDSINKLASAARSSSSYASKRKYATYLFQHGHYSHELGLSTFLPLVNEVSKISVDAKSGFRAILTRSKKHFKEVTASMRHEVAELLTKQFEDEIGWEEFSRVRDQKLKKQVSDYENNMRIRREILDMMAQCDDDK